VLPLNPLKVAVTFVVPAATPVSTPVIELIVAMPVFAEAKDAPVQLAGEPTLYVHCAVQVVVCPTATEAAQIGLTPVRTGAAAVTVNAKLGEVNEPALTVRFVDPAAIPATEPVLVMLASAGTELVQVPIVVPLASVLGPQVV
jgi:hypothetical protein